MSESEVTVLSDSDTCLLYTSNRSYTTWTGESGYKKEPIQVIMTIISKYESQQLKQIVASEDPDAFITYTDHLEIIGNFEKRFDA